MILNEQQSMIRDTARQFARQIVEHLRAVMLIKLGDPALVDLPAEQRGTFNTQAEHLELDRLTRAIKLFNQATLDLRGGWQPQLPLELALIEALQQSAVTPAATVAVATASRKPAQAATYAACMRAFLPAMRTNPWSAKIPHWNRTFNLSIKGSPNDSAKCIRRRLLNRQTTKGVGNREILWVTALTARQSSRVDSVSI